MANIVLHNGNRFVAVPAKSKHQFLGLGIIDDIDRNVDVARKADLGPERDGETAHQGVGASEARKVTPDVCDYFARFDVNAHARAIP